MAQTPGVLRKLNMSSGDYSDMPRAERVDNALVVAVQAWNDRQELEKQRIKDVRAYMLNELGLAEDL